MSSAGLGLALVWLLSAAPLFLPQASGSSPVALACLPWLVWATLPRAQRDNGALEPLAPWLAAPLVVLSLGLARIRTSRCARIRPIAPGLGALRARGTDVRAHARARRGLAHAAARDLARGRARRARPARRGRRAGCARRAALELDPGPRSPRA